MNNLIGTTQSSIETIRHYVESALSENTRKAYKNDLDHYRQWGGKVPSTPETIAAYLSTHADKLSVATLSRRLVSISKVHTMRGHPDPAKSDLVRLTFRGIRKVHGKPQVQAAPILKDDLIVMLSHIPETIKGQRDKALLMLGFCGALRRSELVAIKIEEIEFTIQGLVLTLPRSKTDQFGSGRKIAVPHGLGRICPVMAVKVWLMHIGSEQGMVFRSVAKGGKISIKGLSGRAVADIIKFYADKAGMAPEKYSGHSLRSGLCTSAAQQGVSSWKIRAQTGHRSDTMLAKYIRNGDLFNDNASGAIF